MKRRQVSFPDFKQNFINNPHGYYPIWSGVEENERGEFVVLIDLICEWRIPDGKALFVEVHFMDKKEFNQIVGYLREGARLLHVAITERIDKLEYPL